MLLGNMQGEVVVVNRLCLFAMSLNIFLTCTVLHRLGVSMSDVYMALFMFTGVYVVIQAVYFVACKFYEFKKIRY